MAIDIKKIIADALLELCETKALSKISISDIIEASSVSRQTFYNHFKDKADLIQYIYTERVLVDWTPASMNQTFEYYEHCVATFKRYTKYHNFMKQACLMTGQNCLSDYMTEHCKELDLEYHQKLYRLIHGPDSVIPDALKFATEYNAIASMAVSISWIISDMPSPPEEIAMHIVSMRHVSISGLIGCDQSDDIAYAKAMNAAEQNSK